MLLKNKLSIDVTDLIKPYEGKWIAISTDHSKVFAAGETFAEVNRLVKDKKEDYIILKVFPLDVSYVPQKG